MAANFSLYKMSLETSVFLTTITSLQILIGSTANCVVILTILRSRELRRRCEDRLIVNLAVADFLALTTFVPWHTYVLTQHGIISKAQLGYYAPLMTFVFNYGGIAIVAIAVDRFIAVVFPLRYTNMMTKNTTLAMIGFSFGTALALAVLQRITYGRVVNLFFVVFDFSLLFGIGVIYLIIFYSAMKQGNAIMKQKQSVHSSIQTNPHRRLVIRTTITSLGFAVLYHATYVPLIVHTIRSYAGENMTISSKLATQNWIFSFLFLNSCINPFVYTLRTKRFKTAFCKMVRSKNALNGLSPTSSHL